MQKPVACSCPTALTGLPWNSGTVADTARALTESSLRERLGGLGAGRVREGVGFERQMQGLKGLAGAQLHAGAAVMQLHPRAVRVSPLAVLVRL